VLAWLDCEEFSLRAILKRMLVPRNQFRQ
jgi:hypothetical protein